MIIYHFCGLQDYFLLEKIAQGTLLLRNTSSYLSEIFPFCNSKVKIFRNPLPPYYFLFAIYHITLNNLEIMVVEPGFGSSSASKSQVSLGSGAKRESTHLLDCSECTHCLPCCSPQPDTEIQTAYSSVEPEEALFTLVKTQVWRCFCCLLFLLIILVHFYFFSNVFCPTQMDTHRLN